MAENTLLPEETFGVIGTFDSAPDIYEACKKTNKAGFKKWDSINDVQRTVPRDRTATAYRYFSMCILFGLGYDFVGKWAFYLYNLVAAA